MIKVDQSKTITDSNLFKSLLEFVSQLEGITFRIESNINIHHEPAVMVTLNASLFGVQAVDFLQSLHFKSLDKSKELWYNGY